MIQHLRHIKYLKSLIDSEVNQSDKWWEAKGRLKQVQIAWGQSMNLAVAVLSDSAKKRMPSDVLEDISWWKTYFYEKLTAPLTKGLEEEYKKKQGVKVDKKEQLMNEEL